MRRKKTRMITLEAGRGYIWCGKRLLTYDEAYDGRYLREGIGNACSHRDFRTAKKAMNVLMSCPKEKGFVLYREYYEIAVKRGSCKSGYNFNSVEDVVEFDRRYEK